MGNNQSPGGVTINVGDYDQALGRSYGEIAAEGRSLHRSQAQGSVREKGPRTTRLTLIDKVPSVSDDSNLLSGTLSKLPDLAQLEPALAADLNQLEQRITAIRTKANILRPAPIVPDLVDALKLFNAIKTKATNEHVQFLLNLKQPDFHEAIRLAAGLVVDVMASDETVIPGRNSISRSMSSMVDHTTSRASAPALDCRRDGMRKSMDRRVALRRVKNFSSVLRLRLGPRPTIRSPIGWNSPASTIGLFGPRAPRQICRSILRS